MAEQGENPVADASGDATAVRDDHVLAVAVVELEHAPVLAGIVAPRHGGRPDQVADHDRESAQLGR